MDHFQKLILIKKIYPTEDFKNFVSPARENLLIQQLNNRIDVKFKISRFFKNKFPYKFSIKSKKKIWYKMDVWRDGRVV